MSKLFTSYAETDQGNTATFRGVGSASSLVHHGVEATQLRANTGLVERYDTLFHTEISHQRNEEGESGLYVRIKRVGAS